MPSGEMDNSRLNFIAAHADGETPVEKAVAGQASALLRILCYFAPVHLPFGRENRNHPLGYMPGSNLIFGSAWPASSLSTVNPEHTFSRIC